jgi:hypothetical protein
MDYGPNPRRLRSASLTRAATRLTILEGEHKTIDLRMQEAK